MNPEVVRYGGCTIRKHSIGPPGGGYDTTIDELGHLGYMNGIDHAKWIIDRLHRNGISQEIIARVVVEAEMPS